MTPDNEGDTSMDAFCTWLHRAPAVGSTYQTLAAALAVAKRDEVASGKYRWVWHRQRSGDFQVVDKPPYMGPWWDADGIQHGR